MSERKPVVILGSNLGGEMPSGDVLPVAVGGTGAATLTGYVKGSGTSALTASASIPNTDITGLGTVSTLAVDTDGTLAANSDSRVASQKATKTYVDALIAANDAMVFKGVVDCSANPNYSAADRGHTYRVSVAGKIGGASGPNVEVGDILLCTTDGTASGNHATVGANWGIIQVNIDGALTTADIGTSGTKIPRLSTANTWGDIQTFDTNVISVGKASSGLGGNVRCKSDDGQSRWLMGLLGTAAAVAWNLYDIVNAWAAITVNATTGVVSCLKGLAIAEGAVIPGKYKPTLTNVANVASSSNATDSASYIRVGDTVTVSGKVTVTPTIGGAVTEVDISLPIASNLANDHECCGTHARTPTLTLPADAGTVIGDATNNRARLIWLATDNTASDRFYHFTYRVIP